ncbi:MAG: HNH endonuclease, partial [Nocardioidaceae bacterium]
VAEIRKLAYRLDPHAVVDRARRAETERRVTTRPAPDTMAYLTALLPVAQAVAVQATLTRTADTLIASGDHRTRGQIMADTLVQRVTGQESAAGVPVQVQLVMSLPTLFGDGQEPAHLDGHGPVPAGLARDIVRNASAADQAWLRRLFARPDTGDLVTLDSRRRCFPRGIARFIRIRDQVCRTPWCDAPIRHIDHAVPDDAGGATSSDNGQGLCERCNYAKQAPGWKARPRPGPRHLIELTTPTGHRYRSTAPPLPGAPTPLTSARSLLESYLEDLVLAS